MGNKILGKRSRSFYKGFNQRQLSYLKEKFESISEKGILNKEKFINAYKINDQIYDAFLAEADFDDGPKVEVDQYEFICAVSYFCNLTVQELGQKFFRMITIKSKKNLIEQADLEAFTAVCVLYNAYLNKTQPPNKEAIKKLNKGKFRKYDVDKNKSLDQDELSKICKKDEDYKNWLYNMGFITKNQLKNSDQIYDLVDSDVGEEVERHLNETNPNVDRIKRGVEHRMQGDDEFQVEEVAGDQFTPPDDKPWKKDTDKITAADFKPAPKVGAPPQYLTLDYVIGYRSFDCRNNLKFDMEDRIIYHQAALGIVMTERKKREQNQPEFEQTYINEHKDDISCLDISGNLVATGQVGSKPMIILWQTEKNKKDGILHSTQIISKELTSSVATVCFSSSQKFLAATCNDANHKLVIYNLVELNQLETQLTSTKTGIVCKGNLSTSLVFDIKFTLDEKTLVAATVTQLLFISFETGVINSSRGDFGNFSSTIALCLLPLTMNKKDVMIAGMGNGSIYFWEKDKCIKAVVGHSGSVSSMCARTDNKSFISGDKTGKIIVWNNKFQKEQQINLKEINKNYPSIMVVALAQNSKKQILIGTKSSHVFLMKIGDNIQKAKVVMSGHSQGTLWALTMHTKKQFLYTGGEDQRLIKWDYVNTKKLILEVKTPYKIRSLDFNQTKNLLLVGFYNGVIQCYDPDSLQKNDKLIYNKIKNPDEEALNLVKFERYGKYFGACYSYPTPKLIIMGINNQEIKPISTIDFTEKIFSFDFTDSSQNEDRFIRVNTVGGRYEVYNISKDKSEKVDNKNKKFISMDWLSHTLPYTPHLKGLYAPYTPGVEQGDITCCARHQLIKSVILVGDKYSKIKLFHYPTFENSLYNKYEGHSNAVTAIKFAPKDKIAVSLGGEEKSILIWKLEATEQQNQIFESAEKADDDETLMDQKSSRPKIKNGEQRQQAAGVKAGATDGLKGQIKIPSNHKPNPKSDNKPPTENLSIHHVFGIRNKYLKDEVRNQGRFTSDGKQILFPTACMAIKMDIQTKDQEIYHEHKEDIVSFAVDAKRQLMATGQMAQKNLLSPLKKILTICIWDIKNKTILQKLDGFHTIAIVLLEFSPSGKLLFTCGNDDKNTYAVYDWKAGTILYSGPVSKAKVNGISWKNQLQFITCGYDHVKFWTQSKSRMGSFKKGQTEGQICCVSSDSTYVTGGANGNIFNWSGHSGELVKGHEGKVQCLLKRGYFIYSGGDDGLIKRWKRQANGSIKNPDLFVKATDAYPNLKEVPRMPQEFAILSIDFASDKSDQLLFITKGCSAIYYNKNKFKIITQGHYKGQLWGLCTSNKYPTFITGGDDKTIRYWDIESKQQIKRTYFQNKIRALDWSNDGQRIVIADSKAIIHYYDKDFNKIQEYKEGKPFKNNAPGKNAGKDVIEGWVQEIKFSPDGQYIAYGTHGKSETIEYLKADSKGIKNFKDFRGVTSAVLHIDWSTDSNTIAVNTQDHNIKFFNLSGQTVSATSLKDEKWATWTQKFGFPVQGIYQDADYTNINTVCRDPSKLLVAVGYDDQTIRTFRYPCYIPKQFHNQYFGHSSHVTRIRFCKDYMVSLGGQDKTIIVWNYQPPQGKAQKKIKQGEAASDSDSDGLDDFDQDDIDIPMKVLQKRKKKPKIQEFYEAQDEGDEFMAVKPWIGAIKEPTYAYPKQTVARPNVDITLQYVHGYRTKDCRQNLYYRDENQLIYHAAAVLIYHNIADNTQTLRTDHNDDILSIDFNRKTGSVITGELGPNPLVNYYVNTKLVNTFKGPVKKGVLACAISPKGQKAVCAGMDDDHQVALLDLKKGIRIDIKKGGKKVILKLGWVNENEFVSIGIKHFKYWSIQKGKLSSKDGQTSQVLVSLAIDQEKGMILAGGSGGKIYSCGGGNIKVAKTLTYFIRPDPTQKQEEERSHSVVESLIIQDEFIGAGTKDGFIFILSKSFEVISKVDLKAKLKQFNLDSYHPSVRSLDYLDNKLLVGTFGSEIYEIDIPNITKAFDVPKNPTTSKPSPIMKPKNIVNHMKCHYSPNNTWTNQVWGLAINKDLIFTCSDDATVRCWSLSKRKLLSSASLNVMNKQDEKKNEKQKKTKNTFVQLEKDKKTNDYVEGSKGRSVLITPDRKFVIVGSKDGRVRIFDFDQQTYAMTIKTTFKHAKEWISDIKFGYNLLIIGSHDNAIYVYDYDEESGDFRRKYRPMQKHSSYITHVDVSRDSCFLQSTCGAYQLLFWDLNTGKQITSGASMLKDERWATWTCNLGWPVQGIYPKCTDGTFIHSVDRSNYSIKGQLFPQAEKNPYLLAGGNNNGKVCVYNFPCTIKNSEFVEGKGHSSHITNVRWNETDEYIVSVGGEDQCLMYWRVNKK